MEKDKVYYLLIKTGYEGIDDIIYLSDNAKEITKKRIEIIRKRYDVFARESYTEECFAEFFCVQKWDGKEFKCCCAELGVEPSKMMLR